MVSGGGRWSVSTGGGESPRDGEPSEMGGGRTPAKRRCGDPVRYIDCRQFGNMMRIDAQKYHLQQESSLQAAAAAKASAAAEG